MVVALLRSRSRSREWDSTAYWLTVLHRPARSGFAWLWAPQRARVVRSFILGAVRLIVAGMALGSAWVASRWVKSMLFGLTPTDPSTIAGAVLVLAGAALLAAYLPAYRPSRVDTMAALDTSESIPPCGRSRSASANLSE